jgi:hypothetical protein
MRAVTVRKLVSEGPLRLTEAGRKFGVDHDTVYKWITDGRRRRSDGEVIYLDGFKGPDGGWRTTEPAHVRFLERLNKRPR